MKTSFSRHLTIGCMLLTVCSALTTQAFSQQHEDDPKALKFLTKLIESYRERPALEVESSLEINLFMDDEDARGEKTKANMIFGGDRKAVVKLRGYETYLSEGHVACMHSQNDEAYFKIEDDDSPFYALMQLFQELPFPHLAIMLGEDAVDDVCMQLHPKAPWLRPTGIEEVVVEGQTFNALTLSSDFAKLTMHVHPKSMLIETSLLDVHSGSLVQAGATLSFEHSFVYVTHDQPLDDSTFVLEHSDRRHVDLIGMLDPDAEELVNEDAKTPEELGRLVGTKAPTFALTTLDGKNIDLEDLKGKIVVVDFWASWCGPCKRALPLLEEVQSWAKQDDVPVQIVAINVWEGALLEDDNPAARLEIVRPQWEALGLSLMVAMDYTDEVAAAYKVTGIPATFVIRADGLVHAQHNGASRDYVEMMKREIQDAIEASAISIKR